MITVHIKNFGGAYCYVYWTDGQGKHHNKHLPSWPDNKQVDAHPDREGVELRFKELRIFNRKTFGRLPAHDGHHYEISGIALQLSVVDRGK